MLKCACVFANDFRCVRCRHLVICNYFGDMSMKACETMCDVCTQRDLVAVNIQNLKKKKFDDVNNRRSTGRILYEMKEVMNSMKVAELVIDVMNVNIEIRTMIIVEMMNSNQRN